MAGVTTFNYTIVDDGGRTESSTVTITFAPPPPPNSPPSVPSRSVNVGGQQVLHLTVVVTDVDGDEVDLKCNGPDNFIIFPSKDPGGGDPTQSNWSVDI